MHRYPDFKAYLDFLPITYQYNLTRTGQIVLNYDFSHFVSSYCKYQHSKNKNGFFFKNVHSFVSA